METTINATLIRNSGIFFCFRISTVLLRLACRNPTKCSKGYLILLSAASSPIVRASVVVYFRGLILRTRGDPPDFLSSSRSSSTRQSFPLTISRTYCSVLPIYSRNDTDSTYKHREVLFRRVSLASEALSNGTVLRPPLLRSYSSSLVSSSVVLLHCRSSVYLATVVLLQTLRSNPLFRGFSFPRLHPPSFSSSNSYRLLTAVISILFALTIVYHAPTAIAPTIRRPLTCPCFYKTEDLDIHRFPLNKNNSFLSETYLAVPNVNSCVSSGVTSADVLCRISDVIPSDC